MSRAGPRNREDQAQNVKRSESFPHSAKPELLSPAESGIVILLQKSILNSVEERGKKVEDMGECSLEVRPEFFDGIEVRRVGRQENQETAGHFDGLPRPPMFVKGGIIHKDHLSGFQRCNEGLFHSGIEDFSIGGATIDTSGNGLAIDIPGDNVLPMKFLPGHKAKHLFPPHLHHLLLPLLFEFFGRKHIDEIYGGVHFLSAIADAASVTLMSLFEHQFGFCFPLMYAFW